MKTRSNTLSNDVDVDLSGDSERRATELLGTTGVQLSVDLLKAGKQHGHLKIPVTSHSTIAHQLRMPVCVINGQQPGPVITLIAGIHGDEYEGTVTLHRLARELTDQDVHGRLILLPSVNIRGLATGTRNNPIDNQNLDTAFPGRINGTPSEQLAHHIVRLFVQPSDLVIDMRSGGRHLQFIPSAAVRFDSDAEQQTRCENSMIAFGAPNCIRFPSSSADSCLQATVHALSKDYIQTELGGGTGYGPHILSIAHSGCLNILRQRRMLKDELQLASTRLLEVRDDSYFIYAPSTGVYEPLTYLGENVWKEEPMANILPLDSSDSTVVPVHAERSATLIASHPGGHVNDGDLIAILAEEVQG